MTVQLRAVGLTCGIGSMLVGARQAGFEVLANLEWRSYYHATDAAGRNTFTSNFPGAVMVKKKEDLTHDQIERLMGVELALGHPECGAYSRMNTTNAWRSEEYVADRMADAGDIPLFCGLVAHFRPKFFAMDDLPPSLGAFPMSAYATALPDYDLFPEWVSNHGYGNIQKNRRRMFMIGARREEKFTFVAREEDHSRTVEDEIGDLPVWPTGRENTANQDPHAVTEACGRGLHMRHLWDRPTYGDLRDWFAREPDGTIFRYHSPNGGVKKKPGWAKVRWGGYCYVLDGGSGYIHSKRNLPLTIRERARIQGFPDDFIFYGTRLNEAGEWNHEKNITMIKQTGKAMPVQFNRYFSERVRDHLMGVSGPANSVRIIPPDKHVDAAKRWYCQEVGYSNQEAACSACWMQSSCEIRTNKYGIGRPAPAVRADDATAAPSRAPSPPEAEGRRRSNSTGEVKRTTARVATAPLKSPDADLSVRTSSQGPARTKDKGTLVEPFPFKKKVTNL